MARGGVTKDLDKKKARIVEILEEAFARGGIDEVKALKPATVWSDDAHSGNPILNQDGWSQNAFSTMFRSLRDKYSPGGTSSGNGGGMQSPARDSGVDGATAGVASKFSRMIQ